MKKISLLTYLTISFLCFGTFSCNKSKSYTITIGVFEKDSLENYIATGNDLILKSEGECQTWSRTAQADSHSSSSHLHYNAAANVSYDDNTTSYTWTEYGPELDQSSIESTCSAGIDGVTKRLIILPTIRINQTFI